MKKNNKNKFFSNLKKFKLNFKQGSLIEKILIIFMLFLVGTFGIGLCFFLYVIFAAPDFDEDLLYTSEASILYDINGNEFAKLGTKTREKITYDDLPEVFVDALVATEDSRYFQHKGVDIARFLKATIGQLIGQSNAGGASTLTMQVIKQTYTSNEASGIRGIIRKFTDIYMAVFKLEKKYTKEQIIEFYVNLPWLGSGAYGIEQASKIYFGKSAKDLTLPEAALIVGLFQAPGAYDPYSYPEKAEARKNQVITLMLRHHYITKEESDIAKAISVKSMLVDNSSNTNIYQGFIDTVVAEVIKRTDLDPATTSMKIYTTFDPEKQDVINGIYNGSVYKWPNDNIQAGIAVIDVNKGSIVAVGAGRNKKAERTLNYANGISRQPGSTAKPIFDYGPAIEYLNWSTGQMVVDDIHTYSNGKSIKNWNNTYEGIMTIKVALGKSRNIPALQTFQKLPQNKLNTFVTGLGIKPEYEKNSTFINESHSIGGFTGTNPVEMAAAFATFARKGIYVEPHSFTKIEFIDSGEIYTVTPEKRTVMSEATAYMMSYMLTYAVNNKLVTAGSKSGTDIASKTGTSTVDSALLKREGINASGVIGDSWQIVFSPDYACATWIGYDETKKAQYLTTNIGGTARKNISKELVKGIMKTNSRFQKPSSVVSATIELETNPLQLASEYTPSNLKSVEYFKKGTVPNEVSTRFSQLQNPTNLKATAEGNTINLTWDPIPTPDGISESYLQEYYNNGYGYYSSKIAEKYYKKRLTYNANYIGNIGYQVYLNNNGNLTSLGYTSGNSFTYNGVITTDTTFVVKSAYSIFKNNMSSGTSVIIKADPNTAIPTNNWNIELNGASTMNVDEYYIFINEGLLPPIKVLSNGVDITKYASISTTCWIGTTNVNCKNLICNNNYTINHNATYNGTTKTETRNIKASC